MDPPSQQSKSLQASTRQEARMPTRRGPTWETEKELQMQQALHKSRELPALPEAWKGKNTTVKAQRQHQVSEGKVRGMAWARRQGRQSKARQRMESKGATESKAKKHTLNRKGMLAARNKITQRKQLERQRIHK